MKGQNDPPGWLDVTLAVPTIGLLLEPCSWTTQDYVSHLRPFWERDRSKQIQVDDQKGLFSLNFERSDGYYFQFNQNNVIVQFRYGLRVVEQPGLLPRTEPEPMQRYLSLLAQCRDLAKEAASLVAGKRRLLRVGVVATGELSADDPPPGVGQYLEHLGSFWPLGLRHVNAKILATLSKTEDWEERCHHTIRTDDDRPNLGFVLDWQRVYREPRAVAALDSSVDSSTERAMEYFNAFGEGAVHGE